MPPMPSLDAATFPSLDAATLTPMVTQALAHLQDNPEMLRQMAGQMMNGMNQMPPEQMARLQNMAMGAEGKKIREAVQGKMTRKQMQKMKKQVQKEKSKVATEAAALSADKADCLPALVINRSRKIKNGKYQGLPDTFESVDLPYGLKIYYNPTDPTENKRVSRLVGKKVGGEGWIVKVSEDAELSEAVVVRIEKEKVEGKEKAALLEVS